MKESEKLTHDKNLYQAPAGKKNDKKFVPKGFDRESEMAAFQSFQSQLSTIQGS